MSRRRRRQEPVALTRLTVTAVGQDFTVSLDGDPVTDAPISRDRLGITIANVVEERGEPVRVDVREPDGRIHSDIITPPTPGAHSGRPRRDQRGPAVHPRCFLPGEQVVIAVIDRVETANRNGVITLSITKELIGDRELILFGRVSGTTHLAGAP